MKKTILSIVLLLTASPASAQIDYPSYVINNIIQSCVANGAPRSACSCLTDGYRKKLSYVQFKEMEERSGAGSQTKADKELVNQIIKTCYQNNEN